MSYYVHPHALCESTFIGAGTRIWAFVHVLPAARIGECCNICDHVFIENDVILGDGVTVKCGVQIWDGITLENGIFVGPNATFTNDRQPTNRGRNGPFVPSRTLVRKNASIGANATLLPGIEIGESAIVGAGAVVTRSVPTFSVVVGNPARVLNRSASTADAALLAEAIQLEHLTEWWRRRGFIPERMRLIDHAEVSAIDQRRCALSLRGKSGCLIQHGSDWVPVPCASDAVNAFLIPPGYVWAVKSGEASLWQVWAGCMEAAESRA